MRRILPVILALLWAGIANAQTVPLGPRFTLPYQTVVDSNGTPIPGAQLFFYVSGTNTPLNTYSNPLLTTANPNPVVANSAGVFPTIFMLGNYKVVLEDSSGNTIWTADPVYASLGGGGGGGGTSFTPGVTSILSAVAPCVLVNSTGTTSACLALTNNYIAAGSFPNITGVGTITSGTWNGSVIGVSYGGTGASSAGATAANNIGALAIASNLSDLNSASTARTNLGLGTAATQNTGTSGANLGFLNGNNTYSGTDTFSGTANFTGLFQVGGSNGTSGQCLQSNGAATPVWSSCASGSGTVNSVTAGNSTITIAGTVTNPTVAVNLANANTWTATQAISTSGNDGLTVNASSLNANVQLSLASSTKWILQALASNSDFGLYDSTGSRYAIQAAPNGSLGIMPSSGSTEVGGISPNMLFTVGNYFGADASGHPYCDVRALGGGTGSASADNTAFTTALSTCAGGKVFIPCGTYHNNSGSSWVDQNGTNIEGASESCAVIETNMTGTSVFTCSGSSNQTRFSRFSILGAANFSLMPTAGYAIDCSGGGNNQHYEDMEIAGTYNGIYPGGTNCTINSSRLEALVGDYMIYEPNGGCQISNNQIDNNSYFNSAGSGFGAGFCAYNTSSGNVGAGCPGAGSPYTKGYVVSSNNYWFIVEACGSPCTTAPQGGGLTPNPFYTNFTDGNVTWQTMQKADLIAVAVGTETWVKDNDLTAPYLYAVSCDGSWGGQKLWVRGNDFGANMGGAIQLIRGCPSSKITENLFIDTGLGLNGSTSGSVGGYPIWDQANGSNADTIVANNTLQSAADGGILVQSGGWSVSNNTFVTNTISGTYQTIQFFAGSADTVTGNTLVSSPHAADFLLTQSGVSRVTVVGNTVQGVPITLTGCTNCISANNN